MPGKCIINRSGYNQMIFTWKVILYESLDEIKSSPFLFICQEYPISFHLSFQYCSSSLLISVVKYPQYPARGIISVVAMENDRENVMKITFIQNWREKCQFRNMGTTRNEYPQLTIQCKIVWLGFNKIVTNLERPFPSLSIENVDFDNTMIHDFILIVEGRELFAHKAILARHSPVLLAMFAAPMKESKENKLIVEDIEYSTMETLLQIIYTGVTTCLDDIDTALKILQAVEKYQMSMIKHICQSKLQLKIEHENVLKLLEEADKYNSDELCQTCITYIIVTKQLNSSELQNIAKTKPNIASNILKACMDDLYSIPVVIST